ncbi:hypothetical protein [Vibrio navarrensis]|uniref:hypothetical protein n=1 Tax=Vibrio navarrensis TaxID=29495 RepID=UPI0015595D84|nr:hypothetical protein [Vibrio navarrensis]
MNVKVQKQAVAQIKVINGLIHLSPQTYEQFFEGLKQQLHLTLEKDFEEQCALVSEQDVARLKKMSDIKEIAVALIDDCIFHNIAKKSELIAMKVACCTTAESYDELDVEEVNHIISKMLDAAKKLFIDREQKVMSAMDGSSLYGHLAKRSGEQLLDILNGISFTSLPENTYEITNAPACLH